MPTYEYRCKNCDHRFDIVQSFTDDALTACPSCGEATLKKVFGNVGITFKGSGFYKTDSRSAGSFGSTRDTDKSDTAGSDKAGGDKAGSGTTSGADKAGSEKAGSEKAGSEKAGSGSTSGSGASTSSASSSSSSGGTSSGTSS